MILKEYLGKALYLNRAVDTISVQRILNVVDQIGVCNIINVRSLIVGLEGRENFFLRISEI